MRYSKPELLKAEVALDAIRGYGKFDEFVADVNPDVPVGTVPAYDVDE